MSASQERKFAVDPTKFFVPGLVSPRDDAHGRAALRNELREIERPPRGGPS
jgi:hypothetical protein